VVGAAQADDDTALEQALLRRLDREDPSYRG
jgi:hypothetical protein